MNLENRVPLSDWTSTLASHRAEGFGMLMAVDRLADGVIELWLRTVASSIVVTTLPRDLSETSPTACSVWPEAEWSEREIHEMFGVKFVHPESNVPLYFAADSELFGTQPLRKDALLKYRNETPWPGAKDPTDANTSPSRRKAVPLGVDPHWNSTRSDAL